jgi:hypothetical protein
MASVFRLLISETLNEHLFFLLLLLDMPFHELLLLHGLAYMRFCGFVAVSFTRI